MVKKESGTETKEESEMVEPRTRWQREVRGGKEDFDLGLGEGVEKVVRTINGFGLRDADVMNRFGLKVGCRDRRADWVAEVCGKIQNFSIELKI